LNGTISRRSLANKKIVVCDLDGTLASSKSPIEKDVSEVLSQFLIYKKMAVISGGKYEQFQKQFLAGITKDPELLSNLYLFPTCATAFYMFKDGDWRQVYAENLKSDEKDKIFSAFEHALASSGYKRPEKSFGEIIEDRGTQITFSALGQKAPLELKKAWDPDQSKRKVIRSYLEQLIPEFEINLGGTTSIDVTRKGIDKAYGIRKICEHLNYKVEDMLFIGDALFEGGNDYPVKQVGVECIQVSGPSETKAILQ